MFIRGVSVIGDVIVISIVSACCGIAFDGVGGIIVGVMIISGVLMTGSVDSVGVGGV